MERELQQRASDVRAAYDRLNYERALLERERPGERACASFVFLCCYFVDEKNVVRLKTNVHRLKENVEKSEMIQNSEILRVFH